MWMFVIFVIFNGNGAVYGGETFQSQQECAAYAKETLKKVPDNVSAMAACVQARRGPGI